MAGTATNELYRRGVRRAFRVRSLSLPLPGTHSLARRDGGRDSTLCVVALPSNADVHVSNGQLPQTSRCGSKPMAAAPPRSPGLGLTAGDVVALGLTCKVTWDDIGPEQYCEFRCAPGGTWVSAQFSADVVREMQREQFVKYLQTWRDIVEMKEDCGATARTLADRGPPLWIADKSGFPLPAGQSHVDRLWFMGEEDGRSEAVSAALHMAPVDPSTRTRLAELHRQVYEHFRQSGTDTSIVLPDCPVELLDASVCSEVLCEHVKWMQEKFEPMRANNRTGLAMVQRRTSQIGSQIPRRYHTKQNRFKSGGSAESDGGDRSGVRNLVKPATNMPAKSAVRPADSGTPSSSSNRAAAPLVRRVQSLTLVLATLVSAVAIVVLERKLTYGAFRQTMRSDPQLCALSGITAPSVEDFLSRIPQWASAPEYSSQSITGLGAGITTSASLGAALRSRWSNICRRLWKHISGTAALK